MLTVWIIDTGDVIRVKYEAILTAAGELGRWKRVITQLRATARTLHTFIDVCTKNKESWWTDLSLHCQACYVLRYGDGLGKHICHAAVLIIFSIFVAYIIFQKQFEAKYFAKLTKTFDFLNFIIRE